MPFGSPGINSGVITSPAVYRLPERVGVRAFLLAGEFLRSAFGESNSAFLPTASLKSLYVVREKDGGFVV